MKIRAIVEFFCFVLSCLFLSVGVVASNNAQTAAESLIVQAEKAYYDSRYVDAIQLYTNARDIARQGKLDKLQCEATYGLGVVYYSIMSYGNALTYLLDAQKRAEEIGLEDLKLKIENGIAGIYFYEGDYDKALEMALRLYDTFMERKDTLSVAYYARNIALLANKKRRFDVARRYLDVALRYMDKSKLSNVLIVEAEFEILQLHYDKVEPIVRQIIDMPAETTDATDRALALIYMSRVLSEDGRCDEAMRYAKEALEIVPVRNKPELFAQMSEISMRQGRLADALRYKDSIIVYMDSVNRLVNHRQMENARIKYEVLNVQKQYAEEISRLRMYRQLMFFIAGVAVLAACLAFVFYRYQRQKSRHKKEIIELELEKERQNKLLAERQMKETELLARIQKERLENVIEQKNKELTMNTMFLSSRNQLVGNLLQSLQQINEVQHNPGIKDLVLHLKQLLRDSAGQDEFLINFEASNPRFVQSLKTAHPELLPSDIRFLAYIRMNLTTAEIASLLNISADSCKRRKIRISKKLGLETSAALYGYIMSLK